MIDFPPSRAAALVRLQQFLPTAGADYAHDRNHDRGPEGVGGVSQLSPYVRHRLLGEDEIVRAVLDRYAFASAEKFIQEVCWRTYWKGWLELRPSIWERYRAEVLAHQQRVETNSGLRTAMTAATLGNTGIDCFDAWARQLVDTGYLHNHARMWFASIWIFTLRLPWQLGADFFLQHLLDGDPASNTLSWRWVAGLQTRGKHYVARAENIARYTDGRFNPVGQLNETAEALPTDELPPAQTLPVLPEPITAANSAWLLHEDDLCANALPVIAAPPIALVIARSPPTRAARVEAFINAAFEDARDRAQQALSLAADAVIDDEDEAAMVERISMLGITQLLTAEAPVGPARARLDALEPLLVQHGITLIRIRHDWDAAFWPHAARGFFQLREKIRPVLRELGIP
jgi:deoxyribodipyrimidine photo-lyase